MLTIEHLSCCYGEQTVLKDISFTAKQHSKLLIIGANGCGKTTLLKAIAGLIPHQGIVSVNGKNTALLSRKEQAKKIGFLSQISSIYFPYTVYETVMHGRYVHLRDGLLRNVDKTNEKIVLKCLEMTGLLALKNKSITTLSGGQLQRVFLARVFAQEPDIILLDEPTNHLDLKHQLELMAYLDDWVKQGPRLVVGVVHDMNLALSFADEILMLKDGGILAHEKGAELDLKLMNELFEIDVISHMKQSLLKWQ
ncbi:MAG: ABC transporter ATP-binding protein [Turicibacter sp.]|nr:ABC transporter ATP-binding protein [Turicibacter sp.]